MDKNSFQKGICRCLRTEIDLVICSLKKKNSENDSEIIKILSNIYEECRNETDSANIFAEFSTIIRLDYQIILLIDEYEKPIFKLMEKIHNNQDNLSQKKDFESDYHQFFSQLKSFVGQKIISKVIMTGVMSIRHLGIFNSFTNFSYDDFYKTTFGFTKNELKSDENIKVLLISLLLKHKCITINDDLETIFINYLDEIFTHYNGFCFTKDVAEESQVISPISFINHIQYLEKQPPNPRIPYNFKNYWVSTGSSAQVADLLPQVSNPYQYPKLIYQAQKQPLNTN